MQAKTTPRINAPYLHVECPRCFQPIRFTLQPMPSGELAYDERAFLLGMSLHGRSCEAGPR
jgi:hypothetical protein